jgi:Xaa-Pro dipeptidase
MPPPNPHFSASRLTDLKQNLVNRGTDSALISAKESLYYYAGLTPQHPTEREAYLFVSLHQNLLYHSPFVAPPPHLPHLPMSHTYPLSKVISQFFSPQTTIGIEKINLTLTEFERLEQYLPQHQFTAIDSIISQQRLIKDTHEQKHLKTAGKIAHQVIRWCQTWLDQPTQVGITEIAVAQEIDHQLKLKSAEAPAFPTIVAFDQNSTFPHHVPNHTQLKPYSLILIDIGASVLQYKSDLTRTWSRQQLTDPLYKRIQSTVISAYRQAKKAAVPHVTATKLDLAARSIIEKAGYGDAFIHTTGHGIGLSAHELPHITSTDITALAPGVAFTIEPGIYLPGQFGYRHENTFIMTSKGAVSTTSNR